MHVIITEFIRLCVRVCSVGPELKHQGKLHGAWLHLENTHLLHNGKLVGSELLSQNKFEEAMRNVETDMAGADIRKVRAQAPKPPQ